MHSLPLSQSYVAFSLIHFLSMIRLIVPAIECMCVHVMHRTSTNYVMQAAWSYYVPNIFPFQISPGPFDFSFTTATVNPVTDTISIPILSDDVVEMEETFGLELTISAGMDLQLGNISQATVSIADVDRKCHM